MEGEDGQSLHFSDMVTDTKGGYSSIDNDGGVETET